MSPPIVFYTGLSGTMYRYQIFGIDGDQFAAIAGNCAFSRCNHAGLWFPLYFGETEDFSSRFANHDKISLAKIHGATNIHIRVNLGGVDSRRTEETDLIRRYKPICNA